MKTFLGLSGTAGYPASSAGARLGEDICRSASSTPLGGRGSVSSHVSRRLAFGAFRCPCNSGVPAVILLRGVRVSAAWQPLVWRWLVLSGWLR